eukprot:1158825-Pelagomonas_calceolata.AAC.4
MAPFTTKWATAPEEGGRLVEKRTERLVKVRAEGLLSGVRLEWLGKACEDVALRHALRLGQAAGIEACTEAGVRVTFIVTCVATSGDFSGRRVH